MNADQVATRRAMLCVYVRNKAMSCAKDALAKQIQFLEPIAKDDQLALIDLEECLKLLAALHRGEGFSTLEDWAKA